MNEKVKGTGVTSCGDSGGESDTSIEIIRCDRCLLLVSKKKKKKKKLTLFS
jgi:hypothetical protein